MRCGERKAPANNKLLLILSMKRFAIILSVVAVCACGNNANQGSDPKMSKKAIILYEKAEKKVKDVETSVEQLQRGTDVQHIIKVLTDARNLDYHFDSAGMNRAAIDKCKALQAKVDQVQEAAVAKAESIILQSKVQVYEGDDILIEKMTEYPVYLEKGDVLYYEVKLQSLVPVKLYNMDTGRMLKSYNKTAVKDSLVVAYPGIYLIEIKPQTSQYASVRIAYKTDNMDRIYNPRSVRTETVSCSKNDFRAYSVKAIKMRNLFEEPRKFTLRSQLKSVVSGSSIALVPIQIPAGATDILYSMRIATSEQGRSSDGDFYRNMSIKYNQIKFLGLPLYERNQGSGLLKTLLDDNRPLREEDAYCNMYLFRSQSEAKRFQDGKASASSLKYDIDCSIVGTQSCNGRLPVNGASKLYLGFENVRVRFTNYLWVEAVAVVPVTEYYRTTYTIN